MTFLLFSCEEIEVCDTTAWTLLRLEVEEICFAGFFADDAKGHNVTN